MARLTTSNKATNEVVKLAEAMADLVQEAGVLELRVQHKEHTLRLRRRQGTAPAAPLSRSMDGHESRSDDDYGTPLTSQYVGVFRPLHPKTEKRLVEVGHTVESNQCLGWIESMGIRHELLAPRAGTVAEILVDPGDPVEFGQVLILIQ